MYEFRIENLLIIVSVLLIILFISHIIFLKKDGRSKQLTVKKAAKDPSGTAVLPAALQTQFVNAGFLFDERQNLLYSSIDCWQRQFGYCGLYDEATSPMGMIIDCEPVRFDYGQKSWLIEFWKGQYNMMTGAEIGVYTAPQSKQASGSFSTLCYDSAAANDFLQLSFVLEKNGKPLFERHGSHWWLTGFLPGMFSEPEELTMHMQITLKNEEMCEQFFIALYNMGYTEHELLVKCPSVLIKFATPKTAQPISRRPVTDLFIQEKNKALCELYTMMTKDIKSISDQFIQVQKNSPALYQQFIQIGKPRSFFELAHKGGN